MKHSMSVCLVGAAASKCGRCHRTSMATGVTWWVSSDILLFTAPRCPVLLPDARSRRIEALNKVIRKSEERIHEIYFARLQLTL
jgi:hypothetical protein